MNRTILTLGEVIKLVELYDMTDDGDISYYSSIQSNVEYKMMYDIDYNHNKYGGKKELELYEGENMEEAKKDMKQMLIEIKVKEFLQFKESCREYLIIHRNKIIYTLGQDDPKKLIDLIADLEEVGITESEIVAEFEKQLGDKK